MSVRILPLLSASALCVLLAASAATAQTEQIAQRPPRTCYMPATTPTLTVMGPNGQAQSTDEFCAEAVFDCSVSYDAYMETTSAVTYTWSVNGMGTWPAPGGYEIIPGATKSSCQVRIKQPWNPPQIQPIFDIVCQIQGGICSEIWIRLNDLRMRTQQDCLRGGEPPVFDGRAAYPNPANNQLTLPAGIRKAQLYDAKGVVRREYQASATKVLDVRELPEGLYHLRLELQDGAVRRQRIEVQH